MLPAKPVAVFCFKNRDGVSANRRTATESRATSGDFLDISSEPAEAEPANAGLTSRPFFVGGGLGFAASLRSGVGVVFALEEHVGYRFFGFQLGGRLDGALWAALSLGQLVGDGFYLLHFDGQFGGDLELWDGGDAQLLLTPSLGLGGAVVGFSNAFANGVDGAFHFQLAAQAEIVLLDGLLGVFFRPLGFDFFVRDGVFTSYVLLAGVNVRL